MTMSPETNAPNAPSSGVWSSTQVYGMGVLCLLIGLAVGYLFVGSRSSAPPANATQASDPPASGTPSPGTSVPPRMRGPGGMDGQPTLDQMKQMADKQAEPLLAKLKDDPKNADLLAQLGAIYFSAHQFKQATDYWGKSLEAKPHNVQVRTLLASCLYYEGDVDGALQQLVRATTDDPKDANSLFNLGMIRWTGKKDGKGALAAWQQLLRTNPQIEPTKKAQVEKLIAKVHQANSIN
ncbi:MAG: tetratricopeptide repeat protein [Terriglobales bacterium]